MADNIQIDVQTTVQNIDVNVTPVSAGTFGIEYSYPAGPQGIQGPAGVNEWGTILGTLSTQTDLWRYLSAVGTSNFDIATLNNYLSTTPVLLSAITVIGSISSANIIYALNGDSNLWNTAYSTSTAYQSISASFVTNTILNTISSQLVTNTSFNNYQTSVAASTATLLPTSVYQNASSSFVGPIGLSAVQQTFATLTLNETSKLLIVDTPVSNVIIIPADNVINFANGSQVNISRIGAGTVTVSASPEVYLRSADDRKQLRVQYSTATVVKLSANDWLLFGDIS